MKAFYRRQAAARVAHAPLCNTLLRYMHWSDCACYWPFPASAAAHLMLCVRAGLEHPTFDTVPVPFALYPRVSTPSLPHCRFHN